jgi:hypothetical protein
VERRKIKKKIKMRKKKKKIFLSRRMARKHVPSALLIMMLKIKLVKLVGMIYLELY